MVRVLHVGLSLLVSSAFAQSTNLTALFRAVLSPGAQIILPGPNGTWSPEVQTRWSDYRAPQYQAVIKPVTEADVQRIVNVARTHGVSFLTTGGGHSTADFSVFAGISIDLGNFKSATLDASNSLLTVGGATEFVDIYNLLYDAGKELPVGSCACPGIVGSSIAAGLSPLMGERGLLTDALTSVRLVTADGRLVTASRTRNPDLFWAIRGAGNNFGVITSATFKVYNATNDGQAMTASMVFPAATNGSFWDALHALDKNMSSKLSITALGFYFREFSLPVVVLNAIYFGPQAEGEALLQPFTDLGPTLVPTTIAMTPQKDLYPPIQGSCDPNQHINLYSLAVTKLDPAALQAAYGDMVNMWQSYPGYQGRMLIQRFPNDAVARVPLYETAYPWRDAIAQISIEGFMTDTGIYPVVDSFETSLRARLVKTSGYPRLATYAGYAKGTEDASAWYGSSLPRLVAVKRQWDPRGFFSNSKPIPT
ncbi:hypothetical protein B0T19DRAFT_444407 [Cercophora scortea]|uniref:FAD-binding PCMH-type domain-containing protein n=1 Tax=Cercophora scortea TaxID=314031 RepID=A0AAE0I8J4_9PEZI|nr:hypothetical protein B0T19DRAFT_444407 [Cercophora scortea]